VGKGKKRGGWRPRKVPGGEEPLLLLLTPFIMASAEEQ